MPSPCSASHRYSAINTRLPVASPTNPTSPACLGAGPVCGANHDPRSYLGAGPVCGADNKALARLLEQPVQDVALALPRPAAHCDHTQRRMHLHGVEGGRGQTGNGSAKQGLAHVPHISVPRVCRYTHLPACMHGVGRDEGSGGAQGGVEGLEGITLSAQLVQGGLSQGSRKSRESICRPLPTTKGQCASCGLIYVRVTFFNTSTAAWPTWNFPSSTE